ncbi:MAG TPA: nuclear transport factor 2 family protein [Candidatus Eisenbacteria bacterium]
MPRLDEGCSSRSFVAAVAVACFFALPELARASTDPSRRATDETEIRAALARWVEAANRQDWKAALEVWAPDLIGWYPGQPDDTYAREQANSTRPKREHSTRFELTIDEVIVSGDLAVVRDTWTIRSGDAAGPAASTLRSFEVWRRQPDGIWKIARWISAPEPTAGK